MFTFDQNSCCDCVQVYNGANHFFWIQDRVLQSSPNMQIRCGATCPSGYWPQVMATGSGPNTCSTCTYPCQTCTNFGNTNCVTCVSNAYLQGSTICWQLNVTDNNAASRPYDANLASRHSMGCTLLKNVNLVQQDVYCVTWNWILRCQRVTLVQDILGHMHAQTIRPMRIRTKMLLMQHSLIRSIIIHMHIKEQMP